MPKATLTQTRHWLLRLASGRPEFNGKSDKEAELVIRPIASSLMKSYDADVFQDESREAVATTLKWFREADIREQLDTWRSVNTRDEFALPPEAETAPVSQEAKYWLAHFYRRPDDRGAERALGLIRAKCDEAFDYLMRNDHRAAGMAVWKHWTVPSRSDLMADWDDEDAVRAMTRKIADLPRTTSRFNQAVWHGTFNAFIQVIKVNAPQHAHAVIEELRALSSGSRPDIARAPSKIETDEVGLFG